MPTKEEARRKYNQNMDLYHQERNARNIAQKNSAICQEDKRQAEAELSGLRANKHNFEERREEVKIIISFFDKNVARSLNNANKAAESTGQTYRKAIHCSGIGSASIEESFHSDTITEDATMLSSAYTDCVSEKNRLDQEIHDLAIKIQQCENQISAFDSQIRKYNNTANAANANMRQYYNRASYYYSFT